MPGEWDLGTIKMRFYYMTDTATTDTIEFVGSAIAFSNGDNINSTISTTYAATDTGLNDDEVVHISPATGDITVEGSPAIRDLIQFRVTRNTSNDTYTGDAHLLGVAIQYRERVVAEEAW